jgi:phosphoglucosamine mutase
LNDDYERFLISTLKGHPDFSSFRIALDCSNGANSHTAPDVFRRLGAEIFVIGASPTGKNINVGCGSQHTDKLSRLVRAKKCRLGIAFDGDGDRVILVDEKGRTLDGDHIMAMLAKNFKQKNILKNNTVVITVMANLGLKKALKKIGAKVVEVAVGDRYVSEAMRQTGAVLGGEQSGHIILGAHLPTGDGLLTALHTLATMEEEKKPLSKLVAWMKKYPQTLLNVPVKERTPLDKLDGVANLIGGIEKNLGDEGRVLVRYSGTEPLLRIMIEASDKKKCDAYAQQIASSVKLANGASRG